MTDPVYQGILFPERAESLAEDAYSGYRVFLNFWEPLARTLGEYYEALANRRDARMLVVHAPQGGGKTLFARKLVSDFQSTPVSALVDYDSENLWHRIASGTITSDRPELIRAARKSTTAIVVTDEKPFGGEVIPANRDWMSKVLQQITADASRRWLVVLDNAERGHFLQSLVELSDAEYITKRHDPHLIELAAQRFVGHARTRLRGCLFVALTNDAEFAGSLDKAVNAQHRGMLSRASLPLPGPSEKETVVRVNTNRLNKISYWYCLDRAGPDDKTAVYTALSGAATFPDSFSAVDKALRSSSRKGRRARSCLLTLVVLTRQAAADIIGSLGQVWRTEVEHGWMQIAYLDEGWADGLVPPRDAGLLESEWMLRVVVLGDQFVSHLVSGDASLEQECGRVLDMLKTAQHPGTHTTTQEATRRDWQQVVDAWPKSTVDTSSFWALGARRSTIYEPVFGRILSDYNVGRPGFLKYRPDYVVEPFEPCSVLSASSGTTEDINRAIRRSAHVFEFTAIDRADAASVKAYLSQKLPNYVEITREQ